MVKMMKQGFTFLLAFSLFFSVSGINVYKHYCGDFLANISFYISADPCSPNDMEESCSKEKEKSYCDDEFEFHHLDITLNFHKLNQVDFALSSFNLISTATFDVEPKIITLQSNSIRQKPPNLNTLPLYKRFKQFTFYG